MLGTAYSRGNGVPKDPSEAVYWYRKAAEQGYPMGQANLGRALLRGQGVERDTEKGLEWIRKALPRDEGLARTILGNAYLRGDGVEKNVAEGLQLLQEAVKELIIGVLIWIFFIAKATILLNFRGENT